LASMRCSRAMEMEKTGQQQPCAISAEGGSRQAAAAVALAAGNANA